MSISHAFEPTDLSVGVNYINAYALYNMILLHMPIQLAYVERQHAYDYTDSLFVVPVRED